MLEPGQAAPSFDLPDADMQNVSLSEFKGKKHVVLYFYPRDGTPGCTMVTTDFSDHEDQFVNHDCVVLGVSRALGVGMRAVGQPLVIAEIVAGIALVTGIHRATHDARVP